MDAQQITGLGFCLLGAVFILFRKRLASGASGYAGTMFKLKVDQGSNVFFEYLYIFTGALVIILGGYIFLA